MRTRIWTAALWCLTILLTTACVDEKVPTSSKAFVDKYFPLSTIVLVETDVDDDGGKEFCVLLNDGTKIDVLKKVDSDGTIRIAVADESFIGKIK